LIAWMTGSRPYTHTSKHLDARVASFVGSSSPCLDRSAHAPVFPFAR
jgi:hypothetical protein